MSAHHQARRSTSKAATEAGDHPAHPSGKIHTLPTEQSHSAPSTKRFRQPSPAHASLGEGPAVMASTVLTPLPASGLIPAKASTTEKLSTEFDDMADAGSSSLSELGDASDDQSEPTPRPTTALDMDEDDSEAETERLENTPRKLTRTATDTSLVSEPLHARTPSKLVHSKLVDQDESAPTTPSAIVDDVVPEDHVEANNPLHSLSLVAASEAASLEHAGKKRKRPSAEETSVGDQEDEPARKRNETAKVPNGLSAGEPDGSGQVDPEEELDHAEERLSQLAHEEVDLEERQANIATEAVGELATVAKHTKPRKGGRRGKRKVEDSGYAYNEQYTGLEAHEGEGEDDHDEEHNAALDEEVAKKKNAIDELAKIEKKFKLFREKLCDEQIAQLERELDMLKQSNSVHPEFQAMIKCIDERRAEKIAYETRLLEYKQNNLEIITAAERHQMHSQYFQTVRHVREEILEECNQRVVELQRGRRSLGCDETEFMVRLPEKRSDQIRQQTAYNLEVSILSGVAKYVGFPAAPDISAARTTEIDEDLRAMKIATRPAPPSFRTYNRTTTTADEAAAEEQFLESTPWANPRHPSHHDARYGGPTRVASYQTPAGQRRVVDLHAPNGSASTIEALSNPPSSNPHHANGRISDSESPVLQMKRAPIDQPTYTNTPSSNPRNAGLLGRDSYGMLSSPAAQHIDGPPEEHFAQRSAGSSNRPLNVGAATGSSASSGTGRADASRPPLTQRHGLGAVSVGNGLFGR